MTKAKCKASKFTAQVLHFLIHVSYLGAKIKKEAETGSFQLNKNQTACASMVTPTFVPIHIPKEKQQHLVSQVSLDIGSMVWAHF